VFDFNKFAVNQDYDFARECVKGIKDYILNDKNKKVDKLFHLEGIFLDITDRTQFHPRVPFGLDDRGGVFENFVKSLGLGNKKIIWKYSEVFNLKNYFSENWFPPALEMFEVQYEEMHNAKNLYYRRDINFMEYFFKRLDVYQYIEATLFMKYYKGVDISKYKEKLRSIMEFVPVLIRDHDFD
jgi:hypothetical protein